MKKSITAALAAFSLLSLGTLFSSCNDVIFYEINNEVKLEDATITGDILSLVRCTADMGNGSKEYLFVANGNIYYKDVDDASKGNPTTEAPATGYNGNWTQLSAPGKVFYLASDSTNLYALTSPVEGNDDSGDMEETGRSLYCYDFSGSKWSDAVSVNGETKLGTSTVKVLCTNDVNPAHRKAYIRISSSTYELNGTTALTDTISPVDYAGSSVTTPQTAAYFNGNTIFSTSSSLVTNARYDSESSSYTDGTVLYWSSSTDIYWCTSSDSTANHLDGAAGTIYAIAPAQNYILLGTSAGASRVLHEGSWIPQSATSDFDTNANSTLSSSYYVFTFLSVDPSKTETGGDFYAATDFKGTSASFSNRVLWAYYPGRGSWNCE